MSLSDLLAGALFVDGDWVETKDQDPDGAVRLVQLADIGDGTFRDKSARFLTAEKAAELGCTFLQPGDVLVARMPEPLGRACIFPGVGQPAVTVVDVCIIRPDSSVINPDWLASAINSPQARAEMQQFVRGTTRQRISRRNLGTLRFRAPHPDTQAVLVGSLTEIARPRGAALAHLATAQHEANRLRLAILQAACAGRLTADWRVSHSDPKEDAAGLIARSLELLAESSRRRTGFDDWQEPDWLDLPDSWRWAPMSDLAEIRGGIQKQPKRAPKDNAYPYLRVANVQRGRLDLGAITQFELFDGELDTYRLEVGDLLVVEGNGSSAEIGRSALWNGEIADCVHQNHIIRVRCVAMDPVFADLFWNSPIAAKEIAALAVTSSGLYSLSAKKIASLGVAVPPLEEQREIVRRAVRLLQVAGGLIDRIADAHTRVGRSTSAVLAQAFREVVAEGSGKT